jgi:asparagine synthase (glutamine-hydrolysing)
MCSVDGFTGKQPFTLEQYASFNQDRGPDGTNYWSNGRVHMAHSLLRIQNNPNEIQQPLEEDGKVLSYNGEIFGINGFDTEHLFNLLRDGDWAQLKYNTNGMWAFSFYDESTQLLTLCRDHFGVKPLYYMEINGELFWSSTVKPLIATLQKLEYNIEMDLGYDKFEVFTDSFWLSPYTRYRYIKRLGPGQILNWSVKDRRIDSFDSIWGSMYSLEPNLNYDPDEYKELAEKCIREACTAPGVSKCISLSGGLDSTLIASLNRNQDNLFCSSIEFEKHIDKNTKVDLMNEAALAEKTCQEFDIPHYKKMVNRNYTEFLPELSERLGDLMWVSSRTVPRLENIRNAKLHGAKIYITGDLADELLTGYNGHSWYFEKKINQITHCYDPIFDRTHEIPLHVIASHVNSEPTLVDYIKRNNIQEVLEWFPLNRLNDDGINNNLFMRLLGSVDSFCGLTDGLAGSFGMESRVPFLHQELAKYILKIPSSHKLRIPWKREIRDGIVKNSGGAGRVGSYKWLIREEMKEYIPEHILNDPSKVGFSTPWNARSYQDNVRKRHKEHQFIVDHIKERFTMS